MKHKWLAFSGPQRKHYFYCFRCNYVSPGHQYVSGGLDQLWSYICIRFHLWWKHSD
jgi:hypothetical protein